MFKKYMLKSEEIKALNITRKEKLLSILAGLLISLLIFLGPIVVFANCIIYYDLYRIFYILIFTCVVAIVFLTEIFYYKGITKGQVNSLKDIYLLDLFLYLFTIAFFAIIMLI